MAGLVAFARFVIIALLGGLAVVVAFKILSGSIPLAGLLEGRGPDGQRGFSLARAQMLVLSVFFALQYLIAAMHGASAGRLPKPSLTLLAIFGGSQAIYLAGKARGLRT